MSNGGALPASQTRAPHGSALMVAQTSPEIENIVVGLMAAGADLKRVQLFTAESEAA